MMDVKCLYKPCLYPLCVKKSCAPTNDDVNTLVDIVSTQIVQDAATTLKTLEIVPPELSYPLMKAALSQTRDRAIEVLLAHWPYTVLSLTRLAPPMFGDLAMRYDPAHLQEMMRRAVKLTTCLAHTFVECLKKRTPTKLQCLDLTGYPAAEVIVNYLSSHVLLVYNEQRQQQIIKTYYDMTKQLPRREHMDLDLDHTLPNKSFRILLDTHLESSETHMEVCRALKTGREDNCQFSFSIQSLDVNCLGLARISVLLEQIDPMSLQGLCLQYNGINREGMQILCPTLQLFTRLKSLDLSCNGMNFTTEHEMCDELALVLSKLPSLTRLDLSNNRTKHKLRRLLSELPRGLSYLRLTACGVSEADITYLKHSHHKDSIKELDLSENQLTHDRWRGVMAFLEAVAGQLEILELEDCGIEKQDFVTFCQNLHLLSCLRYLNVARNDNLCLMTLGDACDMLTDLNSLEVVKASYPNDCYVSSEAEVVEPVKALFQTRLLALVNALCEKKSRTRLIVHLTGP